MSEESAGMTRLDFKNLPLVEAAVRASFQSPIPISYRVIFSLHEGLRDRFPIVREPSDIEIAPGVGPTPAEFGPAQLPGVVFADDGHGIDVSVHPQVIIARWVKRFGPRDAPYPRFPALQDALWSTVDVARQTRVDDFPGVFVVNMSYVNFLPIPHSGTLVMEYFSGAAQLEALSRAGQVRKLEATWGEQDAIDVRFAIEQATAKVGDHPDEGYRLTTAAGLRIPASLDAKSGLVRVHARLQTFFTDLISDRAKNEWQLEVRQDD